MGRVKKYYQASLRGGQKSEQYVRGGSPADSMRGPPDWRLWQSERVQNLRVFRTCAKAGNAIARFQSGSGRDQLQPYLRRFTSEKWAAAGIFPARRRADPFDVQNAKRWK